MSKEKKRVKLFSRESDAHRNRSHRIFSPPSLHLIQFNTAMFHHFKEPVMITDGHMQYLFDEKGRR